MRIVAVLNQKGGVGKTTTTVNLGAALALRGHRVLLIDSDAQGNLSDHLGIDPMTAEKSIYDVLTDDMSIAEATQTTETSGLFVVPSHPDVAASEQELASEIGRELRLRRALAAVPDDTYDWVLIDCPPSLGLLSLNAMAAAGELIVTVQTEYFALRGLGQLDKIVQMVREHINPDLRILGILPTLVNPVTVLAREVAAEIVVHYGDLVLKTRIRQNVRLAEAPGHGQHIFDYKPLSPGAEDYAALADEIEAIPAPVKTAPVVETPVVEQAPEAPDPEAETRAAVAPAAVAPAAVAPAAVAPAAVAPEIQDAETQDTAPDDGTPDGGASSDTASSDTASSDGGSAEDESNTHASEPEPAQAPEQPHPGPSGNGSTAHADALNTPDTGPSTASTGPASTDVGHGQRRDAGLKDDVGLKDDAGSTGSDHSASGGGGTGSSDATSALRADTPHTSTPSTGSGQPGTSQSAIPNTGPAARFIMPPPRL